MCRAATCEKCKKTTWAGCGRHVDSVMKDVPEDQRCKCKRQPPRRSLLDLVTTLLGCR